MFNLGLEKSEGQEIKLPMIKEKTGEFQKNIYLCFIDKAKAFNSVGHNKVWKILQELKYQNTLLAS